MTDQATVGQLLIERGLRAEIERLSAELNKAHRLLSQSVGWQRDAEIIKAKQAAEIERLRAIPAKLREVCFSAARTDMVGDDDWRAGYMQALRDCEALMRAAKDGAALEPKP
jgi:hypothetical protein